MTQQAKTARPRPGGRSARVRETTLRAALDQLLEHGYEGLSAGAVAERAGVAVTTVYRRWPTKPELAAAALGSLAADANPMPDTGTLAGDLHALLAQVLDLLRRPEVERTVRAAAALDPATPGVETARAAFWGTRFAGASAIVDRAVARGELPAGTDAEAVVETLAGPAYLRLLLTGWPLDAALVDDSVRRTIAAFAHG